MMKKGSKEASASSSRVPEVAASSRLPATEFKNPFLTPNASQVSGEIVVAYGKPEDVADDIRQVRNEIDLRWLRAGGAVCKTVAVVSPDRNEGRTFVAANLAVAFSQVGKRVLLIDADLRRGRIHELFGLPNTGGLSIVLTGNTEAEALYSIPGLPGLTIIPSGPRPPNPSDLLAMPSLPGLLSQARRSFDLIVLDTPDWRESPDVPAIAAAAGGVVITTRLAQSKTKHVSALRNAMRTMGLSVAASLVMEF